MKKIKIGKKRYTLLEVLIILILGIGIYFYQNYEEKNNIIETQDPKTENKVKVTLNKCVDGDTAWFNTDNDVIKTRFLAIDTPETVHPNKGVEAYGKDASEYTCNKLTNANNIYLEYEKTSAHYDKYNRSLVWVWVDDNLLQSSLLEVGYAKVYYIYAKYTYIDLLYDSQNKAQENKVGLWTDYSKTTNKNNFTITFKYNNLITKTDGELIDNPIKEGYEFNGWKENSSFHDFSKPLTKNITLTPAFTKK